MRINNRHYQTIWLGDNGFVYVIDQRKLPHQFEIVQLRTLEDSIFAIKEMIVRGAPLIGVTAAYGMYLAIKEFNTNNLHDLNNIEDVFNEFLYKSADKLKKSRPTAVNLAWAVDSILNALEKHSDKSSNMIDKKNIFTNKEQVALNTALFVEKNDILACNKIGQNGLEVIKKIYKEKKRCINILTHCNAGWLATVDFGTALAPVYAARDLNIPIHVWVDETRPRNQGASLTTFELLHEDISHTLIVDNAGGYLMQNNMVDLVLVGADRIAKNGDTANKIGTYLKALAAKDNKIDFYVAAPISTFDENISKGTNIIIEERDESEILYVSGIASNGEIEKIRISSEVTRASNYAFDITPSHLISGWITEKEILYDF